MSEDAKSFNAALKEFLFILKKSKLFTRIDKAERKRLAKIFEAVFYERFRFWKSNFNGFVEKRLFDTMVSEVINLRLGAYSGADCKLVINNFKTAPRFGDTKIKEKNEGMAKIFAHWFAVLLAMVEYGLVLSEVFNKFFRRGYREVYQPQKEALDVFKREGISIHGYIRIRIYQIAENAELKGNHLKFVTDFADLFV